MSESRELLEFIYQNAKMGETTLPRVIGMVSRPDLRIALCSQLMEYCTICGEAAEQLRKAGAAPRSPDGVKGAMADAMLRVESVVGRSPRQIAERMIRGSTMGTVQMSKRIHAYRYTAGADALALADRLLETEENNIEQMKAFL